MEKSLKTLKEEMKRSNLPDDRSREQVELMLVDVKPEQMEVQETGEMKM